MSGLLFLLFLFFRVTVLHGVRTKGAHSKWVANRNVHDLVQHVRNECLTRLEEGENGHQHDVAVVNRGILDQIHLLCYVLAYTHHKHAQSSEVCYMARYELKRTRRFERTSFVICFFLFNRTSEPCSTTNNLRFNWNDRRILATHDRLTGLKWRVRVPNTRNNIWNNLIWTKFHWTGATKKSKVDIWLFFRPNSVIKKYFFFCFHDNRP